MATKRHQILWLKLIIGLSLLFLGLYTIIYFFDLSDKFIINSATILTCAGFFCVFFLRQSRKNTHEISNLFDITELSTPAVIVSQQGAILKTSRTFDHLFNIDLSLDGNFTDVLACFDPKTHLHDLAIQKKPRLFRLSVSSEESKLFAISVEAKGQDYLILFHPQLNDQELGDSSEDTPFMRALDAKYLFNQAPAVNIVLDSKFIIQACNLNFHKTVLKDMAYTAQTSIDVFLQPESFDGFRAAVDELKHQDVLHSVCELEFMNSVLACAYIRPLSFTDPCNGIEFSGYFLQLFDNSEQKNMQTRLLHTQKLQALGRLAGGIAHDFNNLLTAMIGYCDLLLMRISPGDQSFTDIMQIKQNTNRATNLVRQLLAFSRQQTLQPKVLNVAETLSDLSLLLQRLIGSNIELDIHYDRDADFIKVDRGQFEQVIVNLVVNAKDAQQGIGHIKIYTSLEKYENENVFDHEYVPPGKYVKIQISDNGCGIKKEYLGRIFDPFFSTKVIGEGAGLGLSTVYGIVKQTGGYISVASHEGHGSTFTILIPHYEPQNQNGDPGHDTLQSVESMTTFEDLTGQETILIAEDEDAVRLFASRALSDKGYNVQQAQNGLEALEYLKLLKEKNEPSPRLLITDVVMPKMDGPTLVRQAVKLFPNMHVLFISRNASSAYRDSVSLDDEIQFLSKPFSLKLLARRVRELLNQELPKRDQSYSKTSHKKKAS